MNTAVTALLGLGADAMDNLFDVVITLPSGATDSTVKAVGAAQEPSAIDLSDQYRIRCQGFTPPKFTVKTYDVKYKTIKIKRPASVVEGDRVFELQFRLDANYNTYRALADWRAKTMIGTTGLARNSLDLASGGLVEVFALASPVSTPANAGEFTGITDAKAHNANTEVATAAWEFKDVWLTELSEPAFKQGAGDPIMITAKFAFGDYKDPYHDWAGLVN